MLRSRSRRSLSSPEPRRAGRRRHARGQAGPGHRASSTPPTWDACVGADQPFLSHAFLAALEASGSACRETGWLPLHAVVERDGRLLGCAPMYLKSHSYGEYVFDWGWANAYERAGGRYYPKLQVAVPFTPVPGPRLLLAPGAGPEVRAALAQRPGRRRRAARRLLAARHLLPASRSGTRSPPPACSGARACSTTGTTAATRASTTSSARSRAASARRSARSARGSPSRA